MSEGLFVIACSELKARDFLSIKGFLERMNDLHQAVFSASIEQEISLLNVHSFGIG